MVPPNVPSGQHSIPGGRSSLSSGRIGYSLGLMTFRIPESLVQSLPQPAELPSVLTAVEADVRRMLSKRDVSAEDLSWIFSVYDKRILGGWLLRALREAGADPLRFRFSKRMTRSGGVTRRLERIIPYRREIEFEIVIADGMISQSFDLPGRAITVGGIVCRDALSALLRVLEHELIHVLEYLLRQRSSCRGAAFQQLARRIFGHSEFVHSLVTPRERAKKQYGIVVGQVVCFGERGVVRKGIVQRISRRATVLVECSRGQHYSDGRRYRKHYVPLEKLRKK